MFNGETEVFIFKDGNVLRLDELVPGATTEDCRNTPIYVDGDSSDYDLQSAVLDAEDCGAFNCANDVLWGAKLQIPATIASSNLKSLNELSITQEKYALAKRNGIGGARVPIP
jgi:hypothetical protein